LRLFYFLAAFDDLLLILEDIEFNLCNLLLVFYLGSISL